MNDLLVDKLKKGEVGVMPTDTIYGIVGSALNQQTVETVYKLRKRTPDKPMIILISSLADLSKFSIQLTEKQIKFLNKIWPNPVSVVLPCSDKKWHYLHRGTNSLAFRLPKKDKLVEIIKQTGPLVAPSANFEGEKPSETINQAKIYFGEKIDLYIDEGEIKSKPSTIIELLENGDFNTLRQGDYLLKK